MRSKHRLPALSLPLLAVLGCGGHVSGNEFGPPPPTSSVVLNVKDYGATGDGSTDDTTAIQATITAVETGGTVWVPDGTYMIDALKGVQLKNDVTLKLSSDAVLKAFPNSSETYEILGVHNVSHVNIIGGTVVGERDAHTGSGGEWGMGVNIADGQSVWVEGVTARECWGDGFYIGGGSQNVTLNNVTSDHNRRQGLSITYADTVLVRNSTFENTTGTMPQAGIDIEPNAGQTVSHVRITGCTFANNARQGVVCSMWAGPPASIDDVTIDHNAFDGNLYTGLFLYETGGHHISNNIFSGNGGAGIYLEQNSDGNLVSGNVVTGSILSGGIKGYGVVINTSRDNTITGNTITNNASEGVHLIDPTGDNVISGNTLSGNGP